MKLHVLSHLQHNEICNDSLAEELGSAARLLTKLLYSLEFGFRFGFVFGFRFKSTFSILDTKYWLRKEAAGGE